ncbi:DnaJ-domain-containing protein [Colletotrichum falcatum]|nr:DnaJ-domain-containing protein [Colletotrichum falcatum]
MSSLPPDPYKILGVSKDAQLSEIRSAHRKLVLKCHPDKVQDPTLKAQKQDEFQKVQQAYELLSNENDRAKYDDTVKLAELRKEMAKANTSAPRAPRTYEVRTAEPRPDTFGKTTSYRSSPNTKMYSQYNSRSWDEEIHSRSNPIFEEPRSARRAASYEKPSRQDDDLRERRRREEKDREREELARDRERRDRERLEKERLMEKKVAEKAARRAAEDKEARRQERKRQEKAEKEREKERRRESEEKSRRHKPPVYSEPVEDDTTFVAKSDKKKSSSSTKEKKEDKRSRSVPRDVAQPRNEPVPPVPAMPAMTLPQIDTQSKYTEAVMNAAKYMESRGSVHPGISRSQTYDVCYAPPVPTPPPAGKSFAAPPPPPIPEEEDPSRRSKSRRSSETKTRDKSSHKKSSPTKDAPLPPAHNIVDASPSSRHMAHFPSTTYPASTSPPKYHLSRSATVNEATFNRPPPGPVRAQTFSHVPAADSDLRGRGRSRMQPQAVSEDSESEDDRRRHRSSRHKTRSPEPAEYGQRTQYTVSNGRTVAVPFESYAAMYRTESPPRKHSSKNTYYERPSMPSREPSYSSAYFPKVKTATYDDVQYSNIPHRYRSEDSYAYA